MVHSGTFDGGTVELRWWNSRTSDVGTVDHLMVKQWNSGTFNGGTVEQRWWNSTTSDGGTGEHLILE